MSDGLATLAQTVSDSSSADLGVGRARRTAIRRPRCSANLQSALDDLRRLAEQRSAAQGVVTAAERSRLLAQHRRRGGAAACASRPTPTWRRRSARSIRCSASSPRSTRRSSRDSATGADVSSAEDTRDSHPHPTLAADRHLDRRQSRRLDVDLHRQRRDAVPGHAAHRQLHPDRDADRRRERQCGDGRRRADHRLLVADGDPIRRAGRLRQAARHRRAAISARSSTRSPAASISAFAETDQIGDTDAPPLPGLFTFAGATGVPATRRSTGLAARSRSTPTSIRRRAATSTCCATAASPTRPTPTYTYNTTGAASYTGRIQQMISAIDDDADVQRRAARRRPTASRLRQRLGELAAEPEPAGERRSRLSELAGQRRRRRRSSNATGVNLDTEMTNMLNIENSYTTTAKLLTTVNAMFSSLLNAV